MKLRSLPSKTNLKDVPVLVRVDWNIPLAGPVKGEDSLKLTRSLPFLKSLAKRGAIVIVLTHLGRPKGRDRKLSARQLIPLLQKHGLELSFHPEPLGKIDVSKAKAGSLHLLENVRFEKGEDKNEQKLIAAYSKLGKLYINDAFASCHRKHASVYGLAKAFKSQAFAGPNLIEEVTQLEKLGKPKRPYIAVIGGKKLTTKIPILQKLLPKCDAVLIGGAMAVPFFVALKRPVGKSFYEKEALTAAKRLLNNKKLLIPGDVMVVEAISPAMKPQIVNAHSISKRSIIVDVGPATLATWGSLLRSAKTILWNGPVGITEFKRSGFGSRFLARHIGLHTKGQVFTVAGGGDTIPVILSVKAQPGFNFISTGGGAMLEFIALDGKLPGLEPLKR